MAHLSFAFFIALIGVLFVRPADLVPALGGVPLYELLFLCCLATAWPVLVDQLDGPALARTPTTVCVLGLVAAVALSHLAHFALDEAVECTWQFAKIVLSYLLLVGMLDTTSRLRHFLGWLLVFIIIVTILSLLQYYEVIDNPALAAFRGNVFDEDTGEIVGVETRICGPGIFSNPNDLCRIIVVGIALALYFIAAGPRPFRPVLAGVIAVLAHALVLTQSRGGLIGLMATVLTLVYTRFGARAALALVCTGVPVLAGVSGGRQTDLSTSSGTGQQRIQIWSDGLEAFRSTPLFGTGMSTYAQYAGGYVAHNSFVEAYVELGFLGGSLFVGALFSAVHMCHLLGRPDRRSPDPALVQVLPYILAILVGYAAGMVSSARVYAIPTYVLLGLAVVYTRLAGAATLLPGYAVTRRLAGRLALVSLIFIVILNIYIMISIR